MLKHIIFKSYQFIIKSKYHVKHIFFYINRRTVVNFFITYTTLSNYIIYLSYITIKKE